jgi:lysophospholipase L1-like esterase
MVGLKNFVLTLLVSAATLASLEGVLRVRQWWKYGSASTGVHGVINDPVTGLPIPKPGYKDKNITINSRGFRSPEIELPKPNRRIRLVFLGGSTTYCAEVSRNEKTWPHLVTEHLKRHWPQAEFDYVNAGVPGYTTAEMLTTLKRRVEVLQPDIVICYEATNDLSSDSRKLAEERGLRPATGKGEGLSRLASYSMLLTIAELNIKIIARQNAAKSGQKRLTFEPRQLSRPFEARMQALVREAKQQNRIVALVTFAPKLRREQSPEERLHAAVTSLFYMPYMSVDGLMTGFDEYNRVIRTTASEAGVILIGGENSIPADDAHYNDSVHFKDAGAEAMAERVANGLIHAEPVREFVTSRWPPVN